MALDNFMFVKPDDDDEFDSDGKKIYKPLVMVYKDEKNKPASVAIPKPTNNNFVPIRIDYEKEFKIIAADKKKRHNSAQKLPKSPFPIALNSNGKRRLKGSENSKSNVKNKRRSITTPKGSSTKRPKPNITGTSSKAKKNLFTLYDECKTKTAPVNKIKHVPDEPKPLPDSDGNSSDLFEQYEIECGILPKTPPPLPVSPMSSVTSKLRNTKISSTSRYDVDRLMLEIKDDMKSYENKYERDLLKIQEIQAKMELDKNQFIARMSSKLNELDQMTYQEDKENQNVVRFASTPKSAHNLRIATLNKNLQRSAKKEVNPDRKMEKAVHLYNSMRSNYAVLSTPKTKRNELMNVDNTISLKLQRQCLMLVDTPMQN